MNRLLEVTSVDQLIGHTPLLELTHIEKEYNLSARLIAKVESFNPAGSVKDRVALSMILSYFESLVPPLVAVPGVKMGFANLVTIFMLYKFSAKETVAVTIIRVVLVSILFGTVLSMVYSLAGAALSLIGMILLKRSKLFSTVTVSVVGGVLHNIGQIVTAMIVMETLCLRAIS